jgi:hypothetical protein
LDFSKKFPIINNKKVLKLFCSQFISHMIGTLVHSWCLSVVCRCYTFFGEKKVARQISEQLSATQAAFQYSDQLLSCVMPQPPPYMDALNAPKQMEQSEEKQPLTV